MSRVAVSVDGAQNSTSVYRGYQGIANRSFVDPDFISGVSISKGPSGAPGAAGAIGGSVNMRTITADDIVPEGESFGMRLKVEGSNNTTPVKAAGGANLAEEFDGLAMVRSQVQRPDLFDVNGGSSSIVVAAKSEAFDLVAGFSRRRYGNYHAGETGPNAPQKSEPHYLCALYPGYCDGMEFYKPGLTAYLPGEEVLNTSQDTTSGLLKGTRFVTMTSMFWSWVIPAMKAGMARPIRWVSSPIWPRAIRGSRRTLRSIAAPRAIATSPITR